MFPPVQDDEKSNKKKVVASGLGGEELSEEEMRLQEEVYRPWLTFFSQNFYKLYWVFFTTSAWSNLRFVFGISFIPTSTKYFVPINHTEHADMTYYNFNLIH